MNLHPDSTARLRWIPVAALAALLLTGCEMLGIETPGMTAAKREADGRAIGAACRHAVRSIEDCHAANPRISRSAIFEGWREMDAYMRENEIEGMPGTPAPAPVTPPQEVILPPAGPATAAAPTPAGATAPPPRQASTPTAPAAATATPGAVQLPPRPAIAPPSPPPR